MTASEDDGHQPQDGEVEQPSDDGERTGAGGLHRVSLGSAGQVSPGRLGRALRAGSGRGRGVSGSPKLLAVCSARKLNVDRHARALERRVGAERQVPGEAEVLARARDERAIVRALGPLAGSPNAAPFSGSTRVEGRAALGQAPRRMARWSSSPRPSGSRSCWSSRSAALRCRSWSRSPSALPESPGKMPVAVKVAPARRRGRSCRS